MSFAALALAAMLAADPVVSITPGPDYAKPTAPDGGTMYVVDTPFVVTADGAAPVQLPPGVIYDRPAWEGLDRMVRADQVAVNECRAELSSCRDASSAWGYVAIAVVALLAGGFVGYKIGVASGNK